MFKIFSLISKACILYFLLIIVFPTNLHSQKIQERSTKEEYDAAKNNSDVNLLVKQLRASQLFCKQRLEHYQIKPLTKNFSSAKYGKFFPDPKSFILASEEKLRKISVDYPRVMKSLIVDVKTFDVQYLNVHSSDLIKRFLEKQISYKKQFKNLDKEKQIQLNTIARDIPGRVFYDFLAFLNCDKLKIKELCLTKTRDMESFEKKISEKTL
jgi:hypothetical protein